jgi:arginyl-tRNA synthetase
MKDVITQAITQTLATLGLPAVDFVVEHPADLSHGDYASNVAMVLGKPVGKSPRVLALELVAALSGQIEYVEKIEIAGPGFINFQLARDFFVAEVARINTLGESWGKNADWAGKRVLVEYTDPNPFKEFHIGHLFTNAVGESIARLFMMQGADTLRVNYQGDVGLHVACAIWGMQKLGLDAEGDFGPQELGRAYALGATTYKTDEQVQSEIRAINRQVYDRSDAFVNTLYDVGKAVSLAYFETVYTAVGTEFSEYFFESETGPRGKELVLSHPEQFPESDGARIFRGEEYGLHTRVFINKEGLPTYEAKELALAKLKEERTGNYDLSVVCTANEVSEYFKVLKQAMSFIYPDLAAKTEHIGHGMVRLSTGKMSSRTGEVIPALDFIDEVATAALAKMGESGHIVPDEDLAKDVAIAAIKYATLRSSILQNAVFDKEQALSFEGDSGPYLQYSHARIVSVLEKARVAGLAPNTACAPEIPYAIERLVYQFPEIVRKAFAERAPHTVAQFLTELAGGFNTFYAAEKIADPNDLHAPYKIAVASAVRTTLKNGLWILGIKAPEQM